MNEEETNEIIEVLHSNDGSERSRARQAIVSSGKQAARVLIPLLSDPNKNVRWEACKAFSDLREPAAADALAEALNDEDEDVRWLAAEALISLGSQAVVPTLRALQTHFNSLFVRQGAHHVLHALEREQMLNLQTLSVLNTLNYLEPQISVPFAARKALESLSESKDPSPGRSGEGHHHKDTPRRREVK